MACYMGCRGCCAKFRWFVFTLAILAAIALLVAGLLKTVPQITILVKCTTQQNALMESGHCWQEFWKADALYFIISCIGLGCLLIALLTCCCFICASNPAKRSRKDQFIQGGMDAPGYDTAAMGDQYNYGMGHHQPGKSGVAVV